MRSTGRLHCYDRGLSPATVNSKRAKLLAIWNCAWRKGYHDRQPRDIPRVREPQKVPSAWTAAEVQALVTYAGSLTGCVGNVPANWYWSTLVQSAWETGLRIGALKKVRQTDCRLEVPAIIARPQDSKTAMGMYCPLTKQAADAISLWYSFRSKGIWHWPYCRRYFFVTFRRIVERAGLKASYAGHDLFHRLRRSHLSHVAVHSLEAARRQAGHTTAAVTQKHYIDPTIANQQAAVNMIPQIVPPKLC